MKSMRRKNHLNMKVRNLQNSTIATLYCRLGNSVTIYLKKKERIKRKRRKAKEKKGRERNRREEEEMEKK